MKRAILATLVLLYALPAAAAAEWFHLEVTKEAWRPTAVRVNVPVAAMSRALPLIPEPRFRRSRLLVGSHEIGAAELRSIVRALDAGGPARCACGGAEIEAFEQEGWIRFDVRDTWDGERTAITMPADVVRALTRGAETELDYLAALNVVVARGGGEIALVDAEGAKVRIWIDDSPRPRTERAVGAALQP